MCVCVSVCLCVCVSVCGCVCLCVYDSHIVNHNPCFTLFILHISFDNQGSEICDRMCVCVYINIK